LSWLAGIPPYLFSTIGDLLIAYIGDEHMTGCVRDGKRGFRAGERYLGSHTASPEDRRFIFSNRDRIAKIRVTQISNADSARVTYMDGGAMNPGITRGYLDSPHYQRVWNGTHRDNEGAGKAPGGHTRHIGNIHRHVAR